MESNNSFLSFRFDLRSLSSSSSSSSSSTIIMWILFVLFTMFNNPICKSFRWFSIRFSKLCMRIKSPFFASFETSSQSWCFDHLAIHLSINIDVRCLDSKMKTPDADVVKIIAIESWCKNFSDDHHRLEEREREKAIVNYNLTQNLRMVKRDRI